MNNLTKIILSIFFIIVFAGLILGLVGNPKNPFSSPDALLGIIIILYIVVALFLPIVLSIVFSKRESIKKIGIGKGLIYGSLISLAINIIDYFVRPGEGFAYLINFALGFISIVYLIIGVIIFFIGKKSQSS